jgi:hypothetical protein
VRVAWVHPSWRDLVIGRLAASGPARRRFLRRCGVHGVVLSLSTAGGAAGERRLPLLVDDQDWDELADRLHGLIPQLERGELIAVLAALREATSDLSRLAGRETRELARIVLRRTATLWDSARAPIPLALLEAWLELGRRLTPRPEPPSLGVTWAELLPARRPHPADRIEVERFADWLTLCELLATYDPLLPKTFGVGSAQVVLAGEFLTEVEDELESISDSADHVIRALELMASVVPGLHRRARHLRWLLADEAALVRGEAYPPPLAGEAGPGEIGLFDVRRVLADL